MMNRSGFVDRIMAFADRPFVKILSGVRGCGKSTILGMIQANLRERGVADSAILFYGFDSTGLQEPKTAMTARQLYFEIKPKLSRDRRTYLFLDEVQEVQDWEMALNSFMIDFDVDIYVAGSDSRTTPKGISTHLTGRYIHFQAFPLSFGEYLAPRKEQGSSASVHGEFERYLRYGGFPAVHENMHENECSQETAWTVVADICNSVFADMARLGQANRPECPKMLERIAGFAFGNAAGDLGGISPVSMNVSMPGFPDEEVHCIDEETLNAGLDMLERVFLLYPCAGYDLQERQTIVGREKIYLADPALGHVALGFPPSIRSRGMHFLLENAVCLELLRRGYGVHVARLEGGEICLVGLRPGEKVYVRVPQVFCGHKA